jgi:hypothetical protein
MTAGRASAGFRCGTVTLIQQAVQVLPGVSIRTGEPRVGAHYVGLPLTLRGQ